MTTKAKSDSVRKKLSNLAQKLKVPYRNVETVFLLERLVARIVADKKLSQHLVFKGGFVGLRVYDSPRYTIDLDALLVNANIDATLVLVKQRAEMDSDDGTWFRFENQINLTTQGEYGGIRQVYRVGIGEILPDIKRAQTINFDLGIGDPVTPGPQKAETPSYFPQNENISWSVYPIETICAEKLHALLMHGDANSRSKDVHDLSIFLPKTDGETLGRALARCFEFRETELPEKISAEIKKINTQRLEQGWANSVSTVAKAPAFKTAFAAVLKNMIKLEKSFK
ncbi:MAG: nucleotidyl transferase AbiEii/AbiGii toxin family protein [Bdellovibrionaceae bacterium]|nr:nucleotidyl transferase AbiEii/AbiGii toxin family protein [Pseudobdellovibrionaceae bacterium]